MDDLDPRHPANRVAKEKARADAEALAAKLKKGSKGGDGANAGRGRPPEKHTHNGTADVPPPPPEPWDNPVPLAEVPAAQPFPLDVLPTNVAQFIEDAAAALNCPPDYVATPVLAIAGAAIGASTALEVKPGWAERPAFYGAVVGPPGTTKTPALRQAAGPVYAEQARLHDIYRRELKAFQQEASEDRPTPRNVFVADITTEKLAEVLQANPRGTVMIRDELTALVYGMNQYKGKGQGADRQFYLSAWAGEPVSVERKNQQAGPVFIAHPFLSVIGGLPPDLLARLRGERGVSDGFLDRFLFSYPEPTPAAGEDWCCVSEEASAAWKDTVAALWALQPERTPEGGLRPHFVRLTACGRRAWERFTAALATAVNGDDFPDCLRGPWSKLKGYGARLGLILHCLRRVAQEVDGEDVDGESIDRAAKLVAYYQSHARKVYATLDADPKVADARHVLVRLPHLVNSVKSEKHSERENTVSKRRIHAEVWGGSRSVEAVEDMVSLLVKHGYLRPLPGDPRPGPGRKPSPLYEVHPGVLDGF